MALRSSNVESVQELCADIEVNFSKLIGLLKTIGADQMCKNDSDFDASAKNCMLKVADFCSKTNLNQSNRMSTTSTSLSNYFVILRHHPLHPRNRVQQSRHKLAPQRMHISVQLL